jgi:hypothetical protein
LKEENKTNQTKNKTKQNRRNKTKQTKQQQNEALIIWVPPVKKPSAEKKKDLVGRAHKLPYNYKLITKQQGEDLGEKREN